MMSSKLEDLKHLVLDLQQGTKLAYYDSGAPDSSDYLTIFAVHGIAYGALIFSRVAALAPSRNIRFVSIVRREYPGSTPLLDNDKSYLTSDSPQRKDFLKARGLEVLIFIDLFVQKEGVPPLASNRSTGGVSLLGWSMGTSFTMSAIANMDALPEESQLRLSLYLKAHVLYDPPSITLGRKNPSVSWNPINPTLPPALIPRFIVEFLTGYYVHGDLNTRSLDALSLYLPSTHRPPSIYNIPIEDQDKIIHLANVAFDNTFLGALTEQSRDNYWKACFSPSSHNIKTRVMTGSQTGFLAMAGYWNIQEDLEASEDKNQIEIMKMVSGANHFMHWDDPEGALENFVELST